MEDSTTVDASTDNSSAAIEDFDFSKPDGGLSETYESENATADDADQADNLEDGATDNEAGEDLQHNEGNGTDPSKMSDKERNNYYAQQRIESRRAGVQVDKSFADDLRSMAREAFIDIEPDEAALEDMDPAVADQIRQLRRNERARDAERAIEQIGAVRENTRLSIMQAEASIPMFNPADKSYNQPLHEEAISNWAHRYLEVEEDSKGNPQVIGVKPGAPTALEYLQEQAKKYEGILKAASLKGQRAAQMNQNRADGRSASAIARGGGNTVSEIESRIGDIPLSSF